MCLLRGKNSIFMYNSTFCPHSVFMCFVWISEQTAIISLYSINWLVFITETECVYCAVRTESLYTIWLKLSGYSIISYIISYHISYHIISYHIISYHIISYHISYHISSYHIISYHISYIIYHIISYVLGNADPRSGHEGQQEELRYGCTPSLTLALDGVGGQRHTPFALPSWNAPVRIV